MATIVLDTHGADTPCMLDGMASTAWPHWSAGPSLQLTRYSLLLCGERSALHKPPLPVKEPVLMEPWGHLATGLRAIDSRLRSEFAGTLQVEIRQRVSGVSMLLPICCEGSTRSCWSPDTWQTRHLQHHHMLPL